MWLAVVYNYCRQVKVYSVQDYKVVHSMSYPVPILSMAMSVSVHAKSVCNVYSRMFIQPTDSHIVVGMSDKLLSIKCRPLKHESSASLSAPPPRGGSYRYFVRGKTYKPTEVGWCAIHVRIWTNNIACRKSILFRFQSSTV